MLVYRMGNALEKDIIFSGKRFDVVGNTFNNGFLNTHKYDEKNYMHFFKNKEDLIRFGILPGYYVFTYDIPEELLAGNYGVGYYDNPDGFCFKYAIEEYALHSEDVLFEYLTCVEYISDDLFFVSSFEEFEKYLGVIYLKKSDRPLLK